MNEDLEKKRQERVASFKLNISEEEEDSGLLSSTLPDNSDDTLMSDSETDDSFPTAPETPRHAVNYDLSDSDFDDEDDPENIVSSGAPLPERELTKEEKKLLRKEKRLDKKRTRIRAKRNRVVFRLVWFTMILFASIMIGQYINVGVNDFLAVGREAENSVSVTIPKNADIDEITDILYDNHVINNKLFFKLYAIFTKSTSGFTNGTFDVMTNKDYMALIDYMQSDMNRTDVVTIRFTEGMKLTDYAKLLEENQVCGADDFLEMCSSDAFDEDYEFIGNIKNAAQRYYKLEGYLFPDTYDFYVGEDIDSVIRKFLANYRRKCYLTQSRVRGFDKKVTIEQRAEALGMTMEDVIIMASMIQAEAADEDDMYVISSILYNRLATLKDGGVNVNGESGLGYLQLDSTVYYPYTSEKDVPASIRSTYVSKYSTYKYEGLPAGPICNPSLAAIEAAVSPADTKYYYFCHKAATDDEPAVAYYAETMSEHLANLEEAGLL